MAAAAVAVVTLLGSASPAAAAEDDGNHLGQLGQACTAGFGFKSLGAGIRSVVADQGNFAGGVPMGLATYC